jgi:hypothetical protein
MATARQGYFVTERGSEVLSPTDASRNGVKEPFFPDICIINTTPL